MMDRHTTQRPSISLRFVDPLLHPVVIGFVGKVDQKKAPKQYARGRVCISCGCRISIYNPQPRCAPCQHQLKLGT